MSDTEIPIKKKVVMTQDRLDKLALARQAALAKKSQMKLLTTQTKELKKLEFESKLDNFTKALEKIKVETQIVEPKVEILKEPKEKPVKKIKKPIPRPITPETSSSESSESSSSSEEKIIYNKKKPKKNTTK